MTDDRDPPEVGPGPAASDPTWIAQGELFTEGGAPVGAVEPPEGRTFKRHDAAHVTTDIHSDEQSRSNAF